MLAGHEAKTGFSRSLTVTVNVQALVLPLASVAVQVTVLTPLLKLEPLAGLQLTVTPGQLSLATGELKTTIALHAPASAFWMISATQVLMTGFSLSLTVTVKVQALVLSLVSVAVQVTVFTPLLKL